MNYSLFLPPLLTSFVIAVLILIVLILWNKERALHDRRLQGRHLHQKGITRFGGAAIIGAFIISILIDKNLVIERPLMGVLIAVGFILLFGLLDDLRQLSWRVQIVFQPMVVLLVFAFGVRLQFVTNPFGGVFLFTNPAGIILSLLIAVVWVMFLMNVINWIDGIDGSAGGITLIGIVTIFLLSLRPEVNQPPIGIITAAILGGLIAFLLFNFNPAKIIAGTSGSMFMGFMLAILAIFAGAKIATTLLVLTVPIMDALWVIGQRLKAGVSIFSADKRHLHFRLLELGWTQKQICYFYYFVTMLVAIIALNTHALGKVVAFGVFAVLIVGILLVINKKTAKA